MGSRKFDAALASALAQADAEAARPDDLYEVTVRMAAPLTADQVEEVAGHGIQADTRRTIFTTRLDAAKLHQVAGLPCISRVSLAQQLRPLSRPE